MIARAFIAPKSRRLRRAGEKFLEFDGSFDFEAVEAAALFERLIGDFLPALAEGLRAFFVELDDGVSGDDGNQSLDAELDCFFYNPFHRIAFEHGHLKSDGDALKALIR